MQKLLGLLLCVVLIGAVAYTQKDKIFKKKAPAAAVAAQQAVEEQEEPAPVEIVITEATEEQKKELFLAATSKNNDKVKEILNNNVSPDFTVPVTIVDNFPLFRSQLEKPLFDYAKPNTDNWTLVFIATASDNTELLKFLAEKNAAFDVTGPSAENLLQTAIKHKNKENAKIILENITIENADAQQINTLLQQAIKAADLELAAMINTYAKKANIDTAPSMPELEKTIKQGNEELIKFVLENNSAINLNAPLASGNTPLFAAVESGNLNLVKEFAFKGADVTAKNSKEQNAFFYIKKKTNAAEIATFLADSGTDLNAPDSKGFTPLMNAIGTKMPEVSTVLLEKGADVNLVANDGSTALILATLVNNRAVAQELLVKGAQVNVAGGPGRQTPLMNAAQRGNTAIAKLLLQNKASDRYKNKEGFKASDIAIQRGYAALYDIIIAQSAK